MNILTVTNPCTLVKTSVKADAILFTRLKKDILDNGIDNFLSGNYKKFSYGVSSSYFYDYEFLNNSFEVSIGNIDIEYDITKLDSNIANNCCDGVIVRLKNQDLNGKGYDKVVNSTLFKYFEVVVYNYIHELFGKMARACYEYEMCMEEDDVFSNDTVEDIYNVFVKENF